jgi:hypothetical protein
MLKARPSAGNVVDLMEARGCRNIRFMLRADGSSLQHRQNWSSQRAVLGIQEAREPSLERRHRPDRYSAQPDLASAVSSR